MNKKYPAKNLYNEIEIDINEYDEINDNYDYDDINDYEDLYNLVKDAYLDSVRSKVWD